MPPKLTAAAVAAAKGNPAVALTLGAGKAADNVVGKATGGAGRYSSNAAGQILTAVTDISKLTGAGGKVQFQLAVKDETGGPSATDYVDFELGPARKSFAEKQGQTVPGAGAGLEMNIKTALAKLKVPGGVPIKQPMGMDDETIEFVGAFVAFDEGGGEFDKAVLNAWEKSQRLAMAIRAQREMVLTMNFGNNHALQFNTRASSTPFTGFVVSVNRAYAHAQRVYYRVVFSVTNRDEVYTGPESSKNKAFLVPTVLRDALAGNSKNADLTSGNVARTVNGASTDAPASGTPDAAATSEALPGGGAGSPKGAGQPAVLPAKPAVVPQTPVDPLDQFTPRG
jgi:hypothetical protein